MKRNNGEINLGKLRFYQIQKIGPISKICLGWKKRKLNTHSLGNKKAITKEEQVKLFKQFLETIFITEPERKLFDQEKELIKIDILNDNDLETIKWNENHKDINVEEVTIIVNKLDI